MDPDAKDLISKILRYMPEERPSLRYILNHRFFKKFFPDADKCLKGPNSSEHKVYLISKDTPQKYNQNHNQEINELGPKSSLTIAYSNIIPNDDYFKTRATTTYNVSPLNSNNFPKEEFSHSKTNGYIMTNPSLINTNQQINTFNVTPLNNDNFPRQTYAVSNINNALPLQQYNNGTKVNGYSLVPSNDLKLKEIQENQKRINELVRKSNAGKYENNNYINRHFGLKKPAYYSEKTLMDIADIIANKNLYSTMTNKELLNFNPKKVNYYSNNYFKPDPDILKWNQQQNLRRESEKLKLGSLYNKYGMTLTPTSKNRYFI